MDGIIIAEKTNMPGLIVKAIKEYGDMTLFSSKILIMHVKSYIYRYLLDKYQKDTAQFIMAHLNDDIVNKLRKELYKRALRTTKDLLRDYPYIVLVSSYSKTLKMYRPDFYILPEHTSKLDQGVIEKIIKESFDLIKGNAKKSFNLKRIRKPYLIYLERENYKEMLDLYVMDKGIDALLMIIADYKEIVPV